MESLHALPVSAGPGLSSYHPKMCMLGWLVTLNCLYMSALQCSGDLFPALPQPFQGQAVRNGWMFSI